MYNQNQCSIAIPGKMHGIAENLTIARGVHTCKQQWLHNFTQSTTEQGQHISIAPILLICFFFYPPLCTKMSSTHLFRHALMYAFCTIFVLTVAIFHKIYCRIHPFTPWWSLKWLHQDFQPQWGLLKAYNSQIYFLMNYGALKKYFSTIESQLLN